MTAFSLRLAPATRLYEQGAIPDRFYLVLRGEVLFEVVSEGGEAEVVSHARAGDLVGHVAAFTGRPTSAAARVEAETVVLAIPIARAVEALREAPELALQLIHAFAGSGRSAADGEAVEARDASDDLDDTHALEEADATDAPAAAAPPPAAGGGLLAVQGEVDPELFFTDTALCPVSGTQFQFLRVRTRAVRPAERESDFHVKYHSINPTHYGVVVCPGCAYAAYFDDFATLDDISRAKLWEDRDARIALATGLTNGMRSAEDAVTVLDLALRCYTLRGANDSRRAVLQHRRAWLERDAGNQSAERSWLIRSRESYQRAYEHDNRISEEAAARIAYLVGDLSLRLGELHEAAQWLETAVRVAPKTSSGIARTARERLQDVRQQIKQERAAS
ncbi:MAG: DUF2225 domain-containing protein [Dehalococcoidia bacterium]